jgi:GT2 family glycosyltransferase
MVDVSIVIRTKNQRDFLVQSLPMIWKQETRWAFEVLIVDSGSPPEVLKWLGGEIENRPAKLLRVNPEEFGFSYVLNLGVRQAAGRYVVCLSGDAVPAHPAWLEHLIAPFTNDRVAGVYGRQRPWAGSHPVERLKLQLRYHEHPELHAHKHIFSNANSAFRKALALQHPFDEALPVCEDYDWARRVQQQGYLICYEPYAEIYHSHLHSNSIEQVRRILEFKLWRFRIDHWRVPLESRLVDSV